MSLESIITAAWEQRDTLSTSTTGEIRNAVDAVISDIDAGKLRVAEKQGSEWQVHQWVKQAILLSFRLNDNKMMDGVPSAFDKVPLKFTGWGEDEFRAAGFRAVPGCFVRRGSFVAPNVILMPSFINIGAYVGMYKFIRPNPGVSMWSRGCPYSCIFCSDIIYQRQPTRYRRPADIADEMLSLRVKGIQHVYVYDDEMIGSKQPDGWMRDIADRIAPLGMNWVCQGRCSQRYITPALVADMKRAGCTTILWGVESMSEHALQMMRKQTKPADIWHSLRLALAWRAYVIGNLKCYECGEESLELRKLELATTALTPTCTTTALALGT